MPIREQRRRELLQLARDISAAVAAFLVTPSGEVTVELTDPQAEAELEGRITRLALSTWSYATDRGSDIIWNAEPLDENGAIAPEPLACVAVTIAGRDELVGLLGVSDTWLPELDGELRSALQFVVSQLREVLDDEDTDEVAPAEEEIEELALPLPVAEEDGDGTEPTALAEEEEPAELDPATASVYSEIVESLDDGVMFCDGDGSILVANRAAHILQGLPTSPRVVGEDFRAVSRLGASDGVPLEPADHPMLRALNGTTVRSEHLVVERDDESKRHLLAFARPLPYRESTGALLVLRDITVQLDENSRLMELALHDPLTGVANRYLLLDYLRRSLNQLRSRGGTMALYYLDLDDFKAVNDKYGHDVGDEVLIAVARRLEGAARSSDVVARLSGDEFVVVAYSATADPGSIDAMTGRMRTILAAPYHIREHSLSVGASVGVELADPRDEDPANLLVRADREMYRRKRSRRRGRGEEQ